MFPHLQHRQPSDNSGSSHEDRRLFCLAASDFYAGLTDQRQRDKFIQTFEAPPAARTLSCSQPSSTGRPGQSEQSYEQMTMELIIREK